MPMQDDNPGIVVAAIASVLLFKKVRLLSIKNFFGNVIY
jgi:hypothetical protein